jgi:hypothetical protein
VPGPQVRPLVREHRGELGGGQQVQGPDTDDDLGLDAGQAICGGGRVVHDERAWRLRITVREQREQLPLTPPRVHRRDERHYEDPAQHSEQREPGEQAPGPDQGHGERLPGAKQLPVGVPLHHGRQSADNPGARHIGAADADRQQGADRRETAGQTERLPQQNRGRRSAPWPSGAQQRASAAQASDGDHGEQRRVGEAPHN